MNRGTAKNDRDDQPAKNAKVLPEISLRLGGVLLTFAILAMP